MSAARMLVLVTLAMALGAGVASAKEVQRVRVCGASECVTFDRGNSGDKLLLFQDAGVPAAAPTAAAPWYRLETTIGASQGEQMDPITFTDAYVPSRDLVRRRGEGGGYAWFSVESDLTPVLRNVTARLAPLPASTLAGLADPGATDAPASAAPRAAAASGTGGATWPWAVIGSALVAAALGWGMARGRATRP